MPVDPVLLLFAGLLSLVLFSRRIHRLGPTAPVAHEVPVAPIAVWDFEHPLGLQAQCVMQSLDEQQWEVRLTREDHVSVECYGSRCTARRRALAIERTLLQQQWQRRSRSFTQTASLSRF